MHEILGQRNVITTMLTVTLFKFLVEWITKNGQSKQLTQFIAPLRTENANNTVRQLPIQTV